MPPLAEALAPLVATGRLAADDPAQAAEHLYALTFGQVIIKPMLGTIELSGAVAARIVTSGVRVFMCLRPRPRRITAHPQPPSRSPCGIISNVRYL